MVHVVSCHHFVSQDVFLSTQEPVAFCCTEEKLFIATPEPAVNVHDLESRGNVIHSFPTIDQVDQLVFCDVGNYIATLEKRANKKSPPTTSVRVYFKWWIDTRGQSIKARIAGSISSHFKNIAQQLEMVELPLKESALCFSCCKKTAVLAVSTGNVVSLFFPSIKPDESVRSRQRDYSHAIDIELNFTVRELCIYECFFACRSENQIQVFEIITENESNVVSDNGTVTNCNKSKISLNENLDEHFVEWRFESCLENGLSDTEWEEHLKKHLHPSSFPITITLPSIEKANQNYTGSDNCEILGPVLTVKGHKIKLKLNSKAFELWPSLSSSNINVTTLLYREFSSQENQALMLLQFIAFHKSDKSLTRSLDPLHAAAMESEDSYPFSSTLPFCVSDTHQFQAVGCFFSMAQEGFLYDVSHSVELVGSYHYTAALKGVVLEPSFLHALTDAGLETYTVHLAHRTIQHFEEVDNIKNACPDFMSSVCLLGLRPFLGVHQLAVSENHLVLISSLEEPTANSELSDSSSCTIYALRKPSPQQVFSDLLEVGQMCKTTSPSTYLLVLSEGHMILRTHLFSDQSANEEIRSLFLKSCILLADYYTCCSNPSEKILAAPYYHLSELPMEEVVQRLFGFQNKLKHVSVLKPLIRYLNPILLDCKPNTAASIPKSVAENILDAYMDESPDNLWKVILCSGISSYRLEKAMLMLKRRITSKRHLLSSSSIAADTLAIVSLLLKKNNADAAQNMMLSLLKSDLASVLTEIYTLIWTKEGISPLGKFALQIRPDAFIEMLLTLVESEKIQIGEIIHVLQEESAEEKPHNTLLLKEFLETLLHDKKTLFGKDSECLILLVKIYLKRLVEDQSKRNVQGSTSSMKHAAVFGPRPSWLNEMPPFNGKSVSRNCNLSNSKNDEENEGDCLCRTCNEDLLKLQAILYQYRSCAEIREQVLEFLSSGEHEIKGHSSLAVLCLDEEKAVKKLLEITPSALFPFAQDMFGSDEKKWCILFSTMQKKIADISEENPMYQTYTKTFHDVLQHLAETMTVPDFVSVLPHGESLYEPYVKLCVKKHKARLLKCKIVTLGNEIKALM